MNLVEVLYLSLFGDGDSGIIRVVAYCLYDKVYWYIFKNCLLPWMPSPHSLPGPVQNQRWKIKIQVCPKAHSFPTPVSSKPMTSLHLYSHPSFKIIIRNWWSSSTHAIISVCSCIRSDPEGGLEGAGSLWKKVSLICKISTREMWGFSSHSSLHPWAFDPQFWYFMSSLNPNIP